MPIFSLPSTSDQDAGAFAAIRRKNPYLTPPLLNGAQAAPEDNPGPPDINERPGVPLVSADSGPGPSVAKDPGARRAGPPSVDLPDTPPQSSTPPLIEQPAPERTGPPPVSANGASLSPSVEGIQQLRPLPVDPPSRQLPPPVPADLQKALDVKMPERPHDKWYQRVGHALNLREDLVHPIYSQAVQSAQQEQQQALQAYGLRQMAAKDREAQLNAQARREQEAATTAYNLAHAANLTDETARRADRDRDAADTRAEANRVREEGRMRDLLHDGAQVITDRRDTVAFPQLPGMPDQKFAPPTPPPQGYTELPSRVAGARMGVPSVEQKRAEQRIYQVPQNVADTLNLDAGQLVDKATFDQHMRNYRQRTGDQSRESRTAVNAQSRVTAAGIRKGGGGPSAGTSDKHRVDSLAGGYLQASQGDVQAAYEAAMKDPRLSPADLPAVTRALKSARLPKPKSATSDLDKLKGLVANMPGSGKPSASGSANPPEQAGPGNRPSPATAVIAPAPSPVRVGQQVRLKNGQMVTVKAVHPDGSFE